jgi:Ca2+/Na+ antiporter
MEDKKQRIFLREAGFLLISTLLVILIFFLAGTFFRIWIRDYRTLIYLTIIFYLIISFYRWLNAMARKYHHTEEEQ